VIRLGDEAEDKVEFLKWLERAIFRGAVRGIWRVIMQEPNSFYSLGLSLISARLAS